MVRLCLPTEYCGDYHMIGGELVAVTVRCPVQIPCDHPAPSHSYLFERAKNNLALPTYPACPDCQGQTEANMSTIGGDPYRGWLSCSCGSLFAVVAVQQ